MISKKDSVPRKLGGYLYSADVFWNQFNDVDFYVEDEQQENFYFVILRKLFPKIRIEKIFPLGGKVNVINEAQANIGNNRCVYLVDKDFDDLLNRKHDFSNLFYLERYCIENYLIEEESLVAFVIDEKPRMKPADIKNKLQCTRLVEDCCSQLMKIFVLFYLVQKHGIDEPNVALPVERFVRKDNKAEIDQGEVEAYQERLKQAWESKQIPVGLDQEFNEAQRLLGETMELAVRNISGKYIVFLVEKQINRLFHTRSVKSNSFSYRLAKNCIFRDLRYLRKGIAQHIGQ
jgi:hypothetical protein